jgi:Flp pilus assembly protein TadG
MERAGMKRFRPGDEPGQGIIELAILIPVLALLVFAMVDTGFWLADYVAIANAARSGARAAATCDAAGISVCPSPTPGVRASSAVADATSNTFFGTCTNPTASTTDATPVATGTPAASNSYAYWTVKASCTYSNPFTPYGNFLKVLTPPSWSVTMRDAQCTPSNNCVSP